MARMNGNLHPEFGYQAIQLPNLGLGLAQHQTPDLEPLQWFKTFLLQNFAFDFLGSLGLLSLSTSDLITSFIPTMILQAGVLICLVDQLEACKGTTFAFSVSDLWTQSCSPSHC